MKPEKRDLRDTIVSELMTRRVVTLRDTDTISHAHQLLLWSGFRHLPVVADGKVVGIVSDRDLLRYVADPSAVLGATPVTEVMTKSVDTVSPKTGVTEASGTMASRKIDALPVVDEKGEIVGILTATDVLAERGRLVHKSGSGSVPTVAQVMRRTVTTIHHDAKLMDAVSLFAQSAFRHLPVVDSDKRVVGILSDRDIRAKVGDPVRVLLDEENVGPDASIVVESIMTENPITVREDASLLELADCFLDERIGAVPVVDADDRLAGIVSYVDVLGYLVGRKK